MIHTGSAVRKLLHYSLAMIGPVGSAGAQFLLSLILLRRLETSAFGTFSFLLVASQFSWGLWSALFCAPLPILMTTGDTESRQAMLRSVMAANLFASIVAFFVFLLVGFGLGLTAVSALLFAAYAAVALLRWFARAHAYAKGNPLKTTSSDIVYSVVLLAGVGVVTLGATANLLALAYGALLLGVTLGMVPFGLEYLTEQFRHVSLRHSSGYVPVWRQHSGWSLLGVLTTEATGNAHVYLVTLISGPAAFAPLAASALMIRPISVAMNALTEFERAQMARQIGEGRIDLATDSVRFFRIILMAGWLFTVIAVVVLLVGAPRLIFPPQYELRVLVIGAALWSAVTAVRALRTPDSVLLQAAGAFRALAMTSVFSSVASIAAVLALLVLGGPLASIAGVMIGEMFFSAAIWRQSGRWKREAQGRVALA